MKRFFLLIVFMAILAISMTVAVAQDGGDTPGFGAPDPDRPVGVTIATDDVQEGYVLISVIQSTDVVLLANDGRVVQRWQGDDYLGQAVYLLDNGHLLRTVSVPDNAYGQGGKWGYTGGRVEELTWDGEIVWSIDFYDDIFVPHHDIEMMPNGNILLVLFERIPGEEALAAGRDPELIPSEENEIWSEKVIEINPQTGDVVWEWRVWDHLIQDYDDTAPNYGVVSEHPERINLNYPELSTAAPADWLHINAIDYNADLDQIMLSSRTESELWIIDHNTTTEESSGEAGDLLYRWGNPMAYDVGTEADRQLYYQHNPIWIPDGYPGAGHILIFDNGGAERRYSRVIEIAPPIDDTGAYIMEPSVPTGPSEVVWQYQADPPEAFYSALISSAQRQPNGNTLITEGLLGHIFEVNSDGDIVWEYYLPPAAWAFRGERYDLSALDVDLSGDLGFPGGAIWGVDCVDGSRPRLHEYLMQEFNSMQLFIETHGDQAQEQWEIEACSEHDGRVGFDD